MRTHAKAKLGLLRKVPLFARCSRAELSRIARLTDELTLPAGRTLTREGETGREFFVLLGGDVEVRRKGHKVGVLTGGDFLGELALVADVPRTATVTTLTPVDVLVLTARDFRTLLREVPSLPAKVLQAVAERLPEREFA
jgi:CRP-like cAMP-binding protein